MFTLEEQYDIKEIIGTGSYSCVYRAIKKESELEVSIKKISNKKYTFSTIIMDDEIEFLRQNIHPNILKFIDLHKTIQNTFIVTEYIKGQDLYDKLASQKLSEEYVKKLFIQILETIDFINSRGYYHRDIKLENILVDDNDKIKLIDFGFVYKHDEKEKVKNFPGSRHYASPELWMRKPDYYKTHDIWAAGIVLYAMLYEKLPFEDDKDIEYHILYMAPRFPVTISYNAILFLEAILDKNCASRPTIKNLLTLRWIKSK